MQVFGVVHPPDPAAKEATFDFAGAGVVNGLSTNILTHQQVPPSTITIKSVLDLGAKEDCHGISWRCENL